MTIVPRWLALAWLLAGIAQASSAPERFLFHTFHDEQLGGLDCSGCHVPVKPGSVMLKRPGHAPCQMCHQAEFAAPKTGAKMNALFCSQCHSSDYPTGAADLRPFPERSGTRAVLTEFSHALHVDSKARVDSATGFRADCTFCHQFPEPGRLAAFPTHEQCAACHAKDGMSPRLGSARSQDCRTCHNPEEIEKPGSTGDKRVLSHRVVTGQYENIAFSHKVHFQTSQPEGFDCTTCHAAVPKSNGLTTLALPAMAVCANCHGSTHGTSASMRMAACGSCHWDSVNPDREPPSHTAAFRSNHAAEAAAPAATCFACHQNVMPSADTKQQCLSCHQVMRPASHTVRWKDDLHGDYAALDRNTCATCHVTEFCSRCHNELPRSHAPLPLFKNGGHARLAMLNERACLTCHTFEGTCLNCHAR